MRKIIDFILSLFRQKNMTDTPGINQDSFMPEATMPIEKKKTISEEDLKRNKLLALHKKRDILLKRIKTNIDNLSQLEILLQEFDFEPQFKKVTKMKEQSQMYLRIIKRTSVDKAFFISVYKNAKQYALTIEILIDGLESND